MTASGQQTTVYLRSIERLLCDTSESFVRLPGDRRLTAKSSGQISRANVLDSASQQGRKTNRTAPHLRMPGMEAHEIAME